MGDPLHESGNGLFELVQHVQRGRMCFADGRAGVAIVDNNLNVGKFLIAARKPASR